MNKMGISLFRPQSKKQVVLSVNSCKLVGKRDIESGRREREGWHMKISISTVGRNEVKTGCGIKLGLQN